MPKRRREKLETTKTHKRRSKRLMLPAAHPLGIYPTRCSKVQLFSRNIISIAASAMERIDENVFNKGFIMNSIRKRNKSNILLKNSLDSIKTSRKLNIVRRMLLSPKILFDGWGRPLDTRKVVIIT